MTGHDPERLAARFVPEKTQRVKTADERPDRMNAAEAGLQENAVSVGGGEQLPRFRVEKIRREAFFRHPEEDGQALPLGGGKHQALVGAADAAAPAVEGIGALPVQPERQRAVVLVEQPLTR